MVSDLLSFQGRNIWNSLPDEIETAQNIEKFKKIKKSKKIKTWVSCK